MPEPEVTVVASDVATARRLLGVVEPGMPTRAVLLDDAGDAAGLPAGRVVLAPGLAGQDPAAVGPGVAALVAGAGAVLLDSTQPGRDLAGWLSATADLPLVWQVDALRRTPDGGIEVERAVMGGSHRLTQRVPPGQPVIVLARPLPVEVEPGRPVVERSALSAGPSALEIVPLEPAAGGASRLAGARVVVSVGRGIGGRDQLGRYRRLADVAGAALGASRAAVDSGWLPFSHQVGQTGATVAPDLYLAFGISGAVQHLAGMRASKRVVAVNTDPDAPISRLADLVIVADAGAVADELLRRLEEGR
ncbi:electron transfer flavoprotein subunit alpha/FixB family protein [Nonomuraea pusilla]|uniref:electron transfer flavoprotein subunit alpha/FixB family protein n=1 Tax=Nonomuraea pusilla TaxID=46177 RepID=UPI00332A3BE4